ncbi:MAG: transposase [Candidatus Competibacter sp.]
MFAAVPTGALVVFDLGFTDCARFAGLTARNVTWLTRAKSNLVYEAAQVRVHTSAVRNRIVWIGAGATRQRVRLIEVQAHGTVHRYLTNELDLTRLPTAQAAGLYRQRWRVEDAFAITQRLLGLAYFYSGAQNAVEMQLWAIWLLYAVLVDLTDAVAEVLACPVADRSLEMVDRSLYFLTQATQQDPTIDPVRYLADHARRLGIRKRTRKPRHEPPPTHIISFLTTHLIS